MKKITDILDKIFHYLTALSFGLVSICVLVQVITRYTPGISAPWTDEMTRLFFMYTIMFGAPMAIKYKEYAVIDIVTNSIHGKPRHIISILDYILICIVGVVGTRQAFIFWKTGSPSFMITTRRSICEKKAPLQGLPSAFHLKA